MVLEQIGEMLKKLRQFEKDLPDILMDLVKDRKKLIIQMNQEEMFGGKDGEGVKITPSYRPSTIKKKKRKNQPYDRVTLKDEGDFHSSIDIFFGKGFFEIISDDKKVEHLQRKYGADILGLSEDNLEKLINHLKEDLKEIFQKILLE